MARSRNIKPGFFSNDVLGELPALTRLLFAGLWVVCDRDGRIEDRPKKIRAEVLPYDECDANEMLNSLMQAGFIDRYEAGGIRVIQVLAWNKHQNPHVKEAASNLPAKAENSASTIQEQGHTQPLPERAGLIPSPLIPDSLNLDSLTELPPAKSDGPSAGGEDNDFPDDPPKPEDAPRFIPTDAARLMMAMKAEGIADGNPSNPKFVELVKAGVTAGELMDVAKRAVKAGKGFNYALGIAIRERQEAAALTGTMATGPLPAARGTAANETFAERDARIGRDRWEEMTGRIHPDNIQTQPPATDYVEDITPKMIRGAA